MLQLGVYRDKERLKSIKEVSLPLLSSVFRALQTSRVLFISQNNAL